MCMAGFICGYVLSISVSFFLTVGDTTAVLHDLDSSFCEFSLVSSFYDCFKLPHVAFFNWKRHPFYLKLLLSLFLAFLKLIYLGKNSISQKGCFSAMP